MVSRTRMVVAVMFGAVLVGAFMAPGASAKALIFWTDPFTSNKIFYANLDGSSTAAKTVNLGGATVTEPWGVALDPATNKVYWADSVRNTISFANLDGSGHGDLVSSGSTGATVSFPIGVVVDHAAGKIYWGNFNGTANHAVSWATLDGKTGGDFNTGTATVSQPAGVTIDHAQNRIYWANSAGGQTISFAKLDPSCTSFCGNDLPITGTSVGTPNGPSIDPTLGKIYWGNFSGTFTIDFANLDGTGGMAANTTGASVSEPVGTAVDPVTGKVYWINRGNATISSANADGSGGAKDLYTSTVTGTEPDFPTILDVPAAAGAPTITATHSSTTLTCSQGTWGQDIVEALYYRAPHSFSYAWALNGHPIPGSSDSITATSPGTYTCTVTASNFAGSTSQTSAAFAVPVPTSSVSQSTSGPSAQLTFTCSGLSGETCSGGFAVTAHETKRGSSVVGVAAREHKHKKKRKKILLVKLGSGSYSVAAGGSRTISFGLNGTGKKLLTQLYKLPTTFTFSATSGTAIGPRTVKFFYTRITSNINFRFAVVPATPPFTKFTQMTISGVPSSGSVTVSCRGGGCPFGRITKKHKTTISLTPQFRKAHLSAGSKVQISITAPNRVGKVEILSTHAGAGPSVARRCLPPGARKPLACA